MTPRRAPDTYTFTVVGTGTFPFDMLRYDRCWPKHEAHINAMSHDRNRRAIVLEGLRQPTRERWQSFGWSVEQTL